MKQMALERAAKKKIETRMYPYSETALPYGSDEAWQKTMGKSAGSRAPEINFEGQTSWYDPPDCNGASGPNHFVQTVNLTYAIYDKMGALLAGPTAINTLFTGLPGSQYNDGDPIVLYDELADRWLIAEFSKSGSNDYMLIAVSSTSNPTETWYKYSFDVDDMPDYPKFGVWQDGYYMGVNNNLGEDTYVFQRSVMLTGGTTPQMVGFNNLWRPGWTGLSFRCVPPVDNDGQAAPDGAPGMFIAFNDDAWLGSDQLWLYELDVDWSTPSNSTFQRIQQLGVTSFDSNFGISWDNITQPNSQKLDAVPQVIMNVPQYRNFGTYQSIICCHTVDVDATNHAGIRWYELRKTAGSSVWIIRQQGTYAPDEKSRWMGSIMLNGNAQIALGYSISSSTTYPGIRYCGQSTSAYNSANGIMDIPEDIIHAGSFAQITENRWGDYALMSVDPIDDRTFWFTSEYVKSGGRQKGTKIASFKFYPDLSIINQSISPNSVAPGSTITAICTIKNLGPGNDETGSILRYYLSNDQTHDNGDQLLYSYAIQSLSANTQTIKSVNLTIPSNASLGNQYILFYIDPENLVEEGDENNNMVTQPLTIIAYDHDYSITNVSFLPTNPIQGQTVTVNATLKNVGLNTEASGQQVKFFVDGAFNNSTTTIPSLAPNATTPVNFSWIATNGAHNLKVQSFLNGDQNPINDYKEIPIYVGVVGNLIIDGATNPVKNLALSPATYSDLTLQLQNTGSAAINGTVTRGGAQSAWVTLTSGTTFSLNPMQTSSYNYRVTIPSGTAIGNYNATITFNYNGGSNVVTLNISVVQYSPGNYEHNFTTSNTLINGSVQSTTILTHYYNNLNFFNLDNDPATNYPTSLDNTKTLTTDEYNRVNASNWTISSAVELESWGTTSHLDMRIPETSFTNQVSNTTYNININTIEKLSNGLNTFRLALDNFVQNAGDVTWDIGNSQVSLRFSQAAWASSHNIPQTTYNQMQAGLDYCRLYFDVVSVNAAGDILLFNNGKQVDYEAVSNTGNNRYFTLSSNEFFTNNYFNIKGDASDNTRVTISNIRLVIHYFMGDPNLVCTKTLNLNSSEINQNVTVNLSFQNIGTNIADEPFYNDSPLPSGLTLVSGSLSGDPGDVDPGLTETTSYIIKGSAVGNYTFGATNVVYENPSGSQFSSTFNAVNLTVNGGNLVLNGQLDNSTIGIGGQINISTSVVGSILNNNVSDAQVLCTIFKPDNTQIQFYLLYNQASQLYTGTYNQTDLYGSYQIGISAVRQFYNDGILTPELTFEVIDQSIYLIPDFTADNISGNAPFAVYFTDFSFAQNTTITSWYWNFGDGSNSILQNPQHIFENPGSYSITLTISDGTITESISKQNYITVNGPPIITINPSTLSFGSITVGSSSVSQSYTVAGSNLTTSITVNAPTGFAVSDASTGPWTSTITLPQTGGNVNTTVYARFSPTVATAYSGNITNASAGATTQNVMVNGTGIDPCPVSIMIAPSANPVCSGTSVTFTATPTNGGASPTYQWKRNGTNVGTNSPTYVLSPNNNDLITCVLTSDLSCATGNPATSNAITMTVNPLLPVSVVITASANLVCSGTSVTFTATPTNGGTSPVYQWKRNGTNMGTNSPTYILSPNNNDVITCVLTSDLSCPTGNPATSNIITMTVNPQPSQPGAITGNTSPGQGTIEIYSILPVAGANTYTWTLPIGWSGSSTTNSITATVGANSGTISVTATNACGTSPASTLNVNVTGTPTIIVSPQTLAFGNVILGSDSPAQSYNVQGSNLTTDILVTAPAGFSVSLSETGPWTGSLPLSMTEGIVNAIVFVRFSPTVATAYSGNITNASAGATTQNVAVSGTGTEVGEPTITVDPPLLSQTLTFTGNCPPAQTYTVSASNLIEDLTIYVHPEVGNAEISLTGEEGDYHLTLTLVPENGAIPPTVIYVRNCPFDYALTDYYSAILNSSSGITQFVDVYTYPVSGNAPITTIANVTAEPGELVNVPVTVSDFNYLGQVQYIIEFDPTVLTFQDLANIYAPYNNWTTVQPVNSNLAQLYINLEYQSDLWMTIPDNEKLFDLVFLYAGGSSSLNFGDCSFYDSWNHLLNDEPASTYYVSGSVSQAIPPPVITNSVNGIINEYYSQMNTPATSYQVVASNLTGDLTIQAFSSSPTPENCQIEVSLFPDQGFDTQLILSPNNGVINTTIFVKPACTDVPVFCMGSIIQSSEGAVSDIIYVTIENEYWIQYAPVVTIHEVMATPGTTVYVPMTGVNFNSVGVAEYYIDYDPEVLSYSGLENIHPSLPYYFICNNCPDPNNCCNGMIDYMLSYVSIINPDINRLYIKVKWEVNHFNVPDGEKVFDIVFNYSAGYSDLIFTGGSYAYSGNMGPYDPEIINEPFEDYYFNGSVSQANPPTIYVSVDTLVFQDVFYNTTSPPLRYMVSGINLTADLEIDAVSDASDFPCLEISRFNESGYANSLSIPQVNGTVENTEIYVKWSAGGACYIYPYSAVLNSSTGAPSKPVLILEGSSGPQVQDAPTIIIGDVGADPGSLVIVPVTVRNFSFLRNLTLVIDYNPQVITFQNCLCNIDPYYTLNTIQVSPELYRLQISIQSWNFDQTLNLPDFSKLLDLEFLYISGSTSLTLSPESYFTGQNNQVLNDEPYSAHYFNGSVGPFTKNINLTICLEGLYNEATGFMNKAQHESGNMFPGTIADRITVKLAKSTFPYNFISVYENLELNQDKTCTLQLPANMDDEYYLVINHRNSIETWSANPVAFGSDNVYYSFTQDPQFSYNSNVKLLGNSWCIYGGDVNQDDVIDTGDMTPVDNDASTFATGYLSTDVNGDGVIDTGDMTIVDNNTSGFISASYPLVPPTAVVETTQITPLSGNSVICSGNVTYQGSTMVTQRGVCWSTSPEPDFYDNHASNGIGLGTYNCQINGLTPDTQYYFRAYAYNGTGFSYGNELSCITPLFTLGEGVNDFDGNSYTSVIIGTQEWMAENLKVTHYNNGDIIPIITDNTWINLTTGAMCWYENDEATYTNPYGALYNYYTVADSRNLCPAGWHVPSDTEWAELIEFLGGANNADEKLKEAGFEHWNPLGFDADNSSGFTGLPGGRRTSNGAFSSIVDQGFWWSTNEATSATAWGRSLGYNFIGIVRNDYNKKNGNSVRCLKTVN